MAKKFLLIIVGVQLSLPGWAQVPIPTAAPLESKSLGDLKGINPQDPPSNYFQFFGQLTKARSDALKEGIGFRMQALKDVIGRKKKLVSSSEEAIDASIEAIERFDNELKSQRKKMLQEQDEIRSATAKVGELTLEQFEIDKRLYGLEEVLKDYKGILTEDLLRPLRDQLEVAYEKLESATPEEKYALIEKIEGVHGALNLADDNQDRQRFSEYETLLANLDGMSEGVEEQVKIQKDKIEATKKHVLETRLNISKARDNGIDSENRLLQTDKELDKQTGVLKFFQKALGRSNDLEKKRRELQAASQTVKGYAKAKQTLLKLNDPEVTNMVNVLDAQFAQNAEDIFEVMKQNRYDADFLLTDMQALQEKNQMSEVQIQFLESEFLKTNDAGEMKLDSTLLGKYIGKRIEKKYENLNREFKAIAKKINELEGFKDQSEKKLKELSKLEDRVKTLEESQVKDFETKLLGAMDTDVIKNKVIAIVKQELQNTLTSFQDEMQGMFKAMSPFYEQRLAFQDLGQGRIQRHLNEIILRPTHESLSVDRGEFCREVYSCESGGIIQELFRGFGTPVQKKLRDRREGQEARPD